MNQKEIDYLLANHIEVKSSIAKGGFGEVFLVYHNLYKGDFALKKIHCRRFNKAEIECLKSIDHVNIIRLYKCYYFDGYVYMLMEFCPVDLYHLLKQKGEFSDESMMNFAFQILKAIKACHDLKIAHNDIKPSNFLLDMYGRVKCCDFGISTMFQDDTTSKTSKGTLFFMSPEMLAEEQHNSLKADIWALGVTLFYLATRTYPYMASDQNLLLKVIKDGKSPINAARNPLLKNVIARCLDVNPETRANIDELLEMPYFQMEAQSIKQMHVGASQTPFRQIIKPKLPMDSKLIMNRLSLIPCKRISPRHNVHSNNTH